MFGRVLKDSMKKEKIVSRGEIVIYKARDKHIKLEVKLEKETVWLTHKQMALLFGKDIRTINEHIQNIFSEGELRQKSTIRNFRIVQIEGKRKIVRDIDCYSLDVIISVGYRVKSKRGTQFRIWATRTLKDYLIKGYVLNQKRLVAENMKRFKDLQEAVNFIKSKSERLELAEHAHKLLDVVNEYTNALTLLYQYDINSLKINGKKKPVFIITYDEAKNMIDKIKEKLAKKGEATELFGQESGCRFESIVGNLYQTFDKKELYPSVEEKAAHLLYFTIKDHPFNDGNKRIASMLFIYYLGKNKYLLKDSGEKKINDNAIVALSLLIATSDPSEKDVMIKIITNLLKCS